MKIKKMDEQQSQQQHYNNNNNNYQQNNSSTVQHTSSQQQNNFNSQPLNQSSNEKKINIPAFLNKNTNDMRRSSF